MITVRWDNDSAKWISGLSQFGDRLFPFMYTAFRRTLRYAQTYARAEMPVFEGDMQRDLRILGIERKSNRKLRLVGTLGFSGDTIMPVDESAHGPAPFSVPWGKHSPGASAHKVYLYHPKTGGSSKGRAKLVRWLKQNAGGDYGGLPDAPTKQDVTEWQKGSGLPPWVVVDPSLTATDYLWGLIADNGDPLAGVLVENVMRAVKTVWER